MEASSWNLCNNTEGPMAPLNMLWRGGGVGAQRGDATSAGWVAQVVKGEAQVCVTELLLLGAGFSQLCTILIGQLRRRRGGETSNCPEHRDQ